MDFTFILGVRGLEWKCENNGVAVITTTTEYYGDCDPIIVEIFWHVRRNHRVRLFSNNQVVLF